MKADGDTDSENYVERCQLLYVAETIILVIYIVWTYVFEHCWIVRWLHQTTVATVLGVIAGALLPFAGIEASLDPNIVLNVCLPLIIVDAGYNLNMWDFYDYWVYIVLLGIFGTLGIFNIVFFFYSGGQLGVLTDGHAMIVALVFSASDTVAPLTLLPYHKYRKLHAIVFGEAIMNDVVCLFLATSVRRAARDASLCSLKSSMQNPVGVSSACSIKMRDVICMALVDISISTLLGVVWGMLTSWTLGVFRKVIKQGPASRPCILVLLSCYVAFLCGDMLNLSGVMVMFVCAVTCKIGVASNLHRGMGDLLAAITDLLGFSAESFLFGYFGMSLVTEFKKWHQLMWARVLIGLLCVACCRLIVVAVARIAVQVLSWSPFMPESMCTRLRLHSSETLMVTTCGMVRGVIAVVLLLTLENQKDKRTIEEQKAHQVLMLVMTIHIISAGPLMSILKGFLKLSEDRMQDNDGPPVSREVARSTIFQGFKELLAMHGRRRSSPHASIVAAADQAAATQPLSTQGIEMADMSSSSQDGQGQDQRATP